MKTCTACATEKEITAFASQAKGRFGVTSICKPLDAAIDAARAGAVTVKAGEL